MEDQQNEYDSYVPNDQRHELNFCDPTYVGDGTVELGCTQGDANLKVLTFFNQSDLQHSSVY